MNEANGARASICGMGFSPEASGAENLLALQKALDLGGEISVDRPGVYKIAGTAFIGSDTTLRFGAGVELKKVDENGPFSHVILNRGALSGKTDRRIQVEGLKLTVDGVRAQGPVFGLRGELAFLHVEDLRIKGFRCHDVVSSNFAIHVCSFDDIIVEDAIIEGDKDGVHLGRGRRFAIRDCSFRTYDDAIALNAHDYASSNPELGWIEDGVVENCHDLSDAKPPIGFFCRILAGAWRDWEPGMEVRNSDSVVSNGRLYRVAMKADGAIYKSLTRPCHEKGAEILDGVKWLMVQEPAVYTAGVRNVVFRDVFLEKPRVAFSIHFDDDNYSRSYYPGAAIPKQEGVSFDDIRVLHDKKEPFLLINTPIDHLSVLNSTLGDTRVEFHGNALPDYGKTVVAFQSCVFKKSGEMELLRNATKGKRIVFKSAGSVELGDGFSAKIVPGEGEIEVDSDLSGLKA